MITQLDKQLENTMTKISKYDVNITFSQEVADAYNAGNILQVGIIVSDLLRTRKELSEQFAVDYKARIKEELLAELASQP